MSTKHTFSKIYQVDTRGVNNNGKKRQSVLKTAKRKWENSSEDTGICLYSIDNSGNDNENDGAGFIKSRQDYNGIAYVDFYVLTRNWEKVTYSGIIGTTPKEMYEDFIKLETEISRKSHIIQENISCELLDIYEIEKNNKTTFCCRIKINYELDVINQPDEPINIAQGYCDRFGFILLFPHGVRHFYEMKHDFNYYKKADGTYTKVYYFKFYSNENERIFNGDIKVQYHEQLAYKFVTHYNSYYKYPRTSIHLYIDKYDLGDTEYYFGLSSKLDIHDGASVSIFLEQIRRKKYSGQDLFTDTAIGKYVATIDKLPSILHTPFNIPVEKIPNEWVSEKLQSLGIMSPGLGSLAENNMLDATKLSRATDKELLKVRGIGLTSLENIRKAYPFKPT
jgi:hypothetical protein